MFKQSAFLCALLLLVFTNCKKDDQPKIEEDQSFFNCKVDGVDYKVSGTLAYGFHFDDSFGIYGLTGDGGAENCFITIPNTLGVGTHTFNTTTRGNFTDLAKVDYSTLFGAGSGSVTIEEIDAKHVKGTFQFTAYDGYTETTKKTISEGKFNVDFR